MTGRLKKIRVKLILIGICLIFLGCFSFFKQKEEKQEQKVFNKYLLSFFKEKASANEITMHYLLENPEKYGLKRTKSLYPEIKKKDLMSEEAEISKEIKQLKRFKYKQLTKKQRNTYEVLSDYLKMQKKLSLYPYYERVLGKSSGQQVQILVTLSEYRLKNKKDIKSYFRLLNGINEYFDSLVSYSKEQVKRNLFISDESLKGVLGQIRNYKI